MNVRTLCLSILHTQEASGYEIRKMCTEGECSYFVEASFGSIYPALSRLEEDGLVASRVEHQSGKPSKKIYTITDAGREAFVDALCEPFGPDVFRSPFLMFARFAHLLPRDLVRKRLDERLAELDKEIADLKQMESDVTKGDSPTHANDAWVVRYGIDCLEVARQQLNAHMGQLLALAQDDEPMADAAQ